MRSPALVFFLTALTLLSGCVYYNAFYHARAASREAELLREARPPGTSPGTAEEELLERVTEKCGRILQLHPDSAWADDALLLLGETHYYQERYESAERRLTEFLHLYPDSELRPEAEYMLASVLLERGNPVSAEAMLEELAAASPPHDLSDDALALVGQARHARKKYDDAAEAYSRALERFRTSDRRAEIRFLAAENYEASGDLDSAAREYALVPEERGSRQYAFEARMRLAEVDLHRGSPESALEVLEYLERRTEDRDDLDRVLLLKGSALEAGGELEDAVATYEGITAEHDRSVASGEAQYRIGVIKRDHYELLEEATESFRRAREEAPRTDVAEEAAQAIEDIRTLEGYLTAIEEGEAAESGTPDLEDDGHRADGEGEPVGGEGEPVSGEGEPVGGEGETIEGEGEPAGEEGGPLEEERVPAGEPGGEPPEGALEDTTLHATVLPPGAALADSAGAALADSAGVALADSASAAPEGPAGEAPEGPAGEAPEGPAGEAPEGPAVVEEEPEPVDEVAVARFRAAELYLFRFEDPTRAMIHYLDVVTLHPDSVLAPKAALAIGWILESWLYDEEGARDAYETIIHEYPDSDYEEAAAEALERMDESFAP